MQHRIRNILLIFIFIFSLILSIFWIRGSYPFKQIPYEPLIGALTALAALIAIMPYNNGYRKSEELKGLQNINLDSSDRFETELNRVQKLLKNIYLDRLEQKTDNRLPITFTLSFTKEGTSKEYLHLENAADDNVPIPDHLIDLFKRYRLLLLVGEPGSGKSSELLSLALEIIEDESISQVPIILRLSYWQEGDKYFEKWLHDSLISGYGFSSEVADMLIEKRLLIPLLDGLDDVARRLERES